MWVINPHTLFQKLPYKYCTYCTCIYIDRDKVLSCISLKLNTYNSDYIEINFNEHVFSCILL